MIGEEKNKDKRKEKYKIYVIMPSMQWCNEQ